MYLLTGFFGLGLYIYLKRFDIYNKWLQFKELNDFVSTRYNSTGKSLRVSCETIFKMYLMDFTTYMREYFYPSNIQFIDDKHAILTFNIGDKVYKNVFRIKKGPIGILSILDENSVDITELVLPFYGPGHDWNKKAFTPAFWKKKKLMFELSTGEQKVFNENTEIEL